jgi:hypothetical protein
MMRYFLLSFFVAFFACKDLKDNKNVDPTASFVKVYNSELFDKTYIPIDIKQTANGEYIILGKTRIEDSQFMGVYILRADAEGNFIGDQTLDAEFVHPLNNLFQIGSDFYFFCMHGLTLNAKLMRINATDGQASEVAQLGVIYPLAASLEGSNFLLYHYNRDELASVISSITPSGSITASKSYSIGTGEFDVEEPIIDHLTGTRPPIPFFCGSVGGKPFFNGFYNYTLSVVFADFNAGEDAVPGVLQGYRDERGLSAGVSLGGNTFAGAKFQYGQNYLLPRVDFNTAEGAVESSSDLEGRSFPQLIPNAPIIIKRMTLGGRNVVLYGSTTQSKQMALFAYDEASGVLLGTKYLGATNPFEIGGFTKTLDEGLAVVGTTYVVGRFPRFCLYKLDSKDLQELLGN